MNNLKTIFLLVSILMSSTSIFSQQRGGRQNSSQAQGQSSQMTMPKVNPENMARIIMYDSDEVLKKLKIKSSQKKTIVIQAISKHNSKINEIKTFNYETFDEVKSFLTKKRNEAKLSRDFSTMKESQMQANGMLAPIRKKVQLQKKMLNATFEKKLSEKEYKKWLKYQQVELKKLNPKAAERPQMKSEQNSQGGGQKRGMGGRSRY